MTKDEDSAEIEAPEVSVSSVAELSSCLYNIRTNVKMFTPLCCGEGQDVFFCRSLSNSK